jgi:hypothetical protein
VPSSVSMALNGTDFQSKPGVSRSSRRQIARARLSV